MLDRMLLARRTLGRHLGARVWPIFPGAGLLALHLTNSIGLSLDTLLYRQVSKTRVRKPILLAGPPRTGTTFLHRWLDAERVGAGTELHRSMYPSLTAQAVVRPFLPMLDALSPARHHPKEIHQTGMRMVETDDVALMFRFFDGFLLYGFVFAWDDVDRQPMFDPRVRDEAARDFAYLDEVWRRSQVATGRDRVVVKMFGAGPRLPSFFQHFPDGRALYTIRDPVQMVPSMLNLLSSALEGWVGFSAQPEDLRHRWAKEVTRGLRGIIERFHEHWTTGELPRDRVRIVPYPRLKSDFEALILEILDFVEHDPDPALREVIRRRADEQASYTSTHRYDLERFGLDEGKLRADFAFVYDDLLG